MPALGTSEVITQPTGGQVRAAQVTTIAHAAATATEYIAAWTIPHGGRLRGVLFTPLAAVTGANTNTTHLNVINCGADGTGTDELGNLDLVSGTDLAATTPNTIASGLTTALADGVTIALQAEKVGTGLLVPAGTAVFLYDGGA